MKKKEKKEKKRNMKSVLLQEEIKIKEEKIEDSYYQLGKKMLTLAEKEEKKVNQLVDEVIEMKKALKEMEKKE